MRFINSVFISKILVTTILGAFIFSGLPTQAQTNDTRNILIINSWHKGMPWQKSVEKGLKLGLKSSNSDARVFSEYLDFGQFSDEKHTEYFEKYILGKYASKRLDLIITEGIPAATFVAKRPNFFQQTKRIYVQPGAHSKKWRDLAAEGRAVPVLQDYQTALTEMHLLMSPETIYIIADTTSAAGRRRLQAVNAALKNMLHSSSIEILSDLPMSKILSMVSQLGDKDVIFYLPFFKDSVGKKFIPYDALRMISENANRPVFSKWESLLGAGIVGGYLLSGERVGEITASIISNQDNARARKPAYAFIYDWRQMKRWGISKDQLPANSTIRYLKPNPVETYKWEISTALVAIVLLAIMSSILFVVNRKRKWAVTALENEHSQLETLVNERTWALQEEIGERENIERSLRDSEARYLSIVDMQTELVTRFTLDGTLTYVNRAYCEFIGDVEENLLGTSLYDDVPANEIAAIKSYFSSFTKDTPVQKNENRLRRQDGELREIEWSNFAQFDENGVIDRFQSVGRDITERKRTEDALKASEARYYSVVDGQTELITRFTPDGQFTFVNGAYCRFCGRTEEEVLSGTIYDDVPESEAEALKNYLASFSKTNPIRETENRLRRHDGQYRDIHWHDIAYFDGKGNITEFQSVARDITAQKKAKLELELATEKAQEANIAKSNFLATMSHEIRTPLNGVLGLAQLLTDTNLNKDQRKKVDTILSSGQILLAIINDVLDMSKIEAGGLELEETLFNLKDLIATIATPFQSLAEDKGLKLRVTDAAHSNILLKGDPVRLRQILWNLLSNAIKFTKEGSVTLTTSTDYKDESDPLDSKIRTLLFSVSDTGTGISPDRIESIFDAFTQEDSTITRKFGGTGLGLSIVKQLTEMMGGTINVESTLGEGTTFSAAIPFAIATETENENYSINHSHDSTEKMYPLKVLVAEDNAVNSMIAQAFLEKFGHQVRLAENGREAVTLASENWADLILMDIHMPEMDGIEATQTIRSSENGMDIPIIGLTAEAFSERHQHFKEIGMDTVLTKPFTEHQLADVLRKFGHRTSSAKSSPSEETPIKDRDHAPDAISYDSYPVGDEHMIDDLKNQMPPELMSSLVQEAEKSLQIRVSQIHEGLETKDAVLIREAAHSIKGSSGTMFATRISELAIFCEENSENFDAIKNLLPTIDQVAKDTIAWWNDKRS
jgi:PAS domain S-box-containing protein